MARIQQRNAKENGNETPTERKRNGVAHNGNGNFFCPLLYVRVDNKDGQSTSFTH